MGQKRVSSDSPQVQTCQGRAWRVGIWHSRALPVSLGSLDVRLHFLPLSDNYEAICKRNELTLYLEATSAWHDFILLSTLYVRRSWFTEFQCIWITELPSDGHSQRLEPLLPFPYDVAEQSPRHNGTRWRHQRRNTWAWDPWTELYITHKGPCCMLDLLIHVWLLASPWTGATRRHLS